MTRLAVDQTACGRPRGALPHWAALCLLLAATTATAAPPAAPYKVPHTAFGAPDLGGIWNNGSITTLERPANIAALVMSEAQAADLERRAVARNTAGDAQSDPNAPPPPVGGNVGGYNQAWWDQGTRVGRVRGEPRSSWIIEPADGKIPYTSAGRADEKKQFTAVRGSYDNPEQRAPAERCLLGYGSTAGPPMLNVGYNNNYQIMQSKDEVVILVEMSHDARIVRLNPKQHLPPTVRPWMGDSIGWWEGDTLVVETTNFNPEEGLRVSDALTYLISTDAKVTERFTRVSADQILYEFKVDDPKTFTQTWRAEIPLRAAKGPIYEYACHEGNYALEGILAGARQDEKSGRKTASAASVGLGE
jgi:hypothetical protein